MRRLASPAYGDGVSSPRTAPDLPGPKLVSDELHQATSSSGRAGPVSSRGLTHMAMQFGQFLDHDLTITPERGAHHSITTILYSSRVGLLRPRGAGPRPSLRTEMPQHPGYFVHWCRLLALHQVTTQKLPNYFKSGLTLRANLDLLLPLPANNLMNLLPLLTVPRFTGRTKRPPVGYVNTAEVFSRPTLASVWATCRPGLNVASPHLRR